MEQPKPDSHNNQAKDKDKESQARTRDIIEQAKGMPNHETTPDPAKPADGEDAPPQPSKGIIALSVNQASGDRPHEKSKPSEIVMPILTVVIAVAAIWSACVFERQLKDSRRDAMIDQRAWVTFDFRLSKEPKSPKDYISITYTLINSGRSPAINATTLYSKGIAAKEMRMDWPGAVQENRPAPNQTTQSLTIAPGTKGSLNTNGFKLDGAGEFAAYGLPQGFLVIRATVWYDDIFGCHHRTTACRWHHQGTPPEEFGFCFTGNKLYDDDSQPECKEARSTTPSRPAMAPPNETIKEDSHNPALPIGTGPSGPTGPVVN